MAYPYISMILLGAGAALFIYLFSDTSRNRQQTNGYYRNRRTTHPPPESGYSPVTNNNVNRTRRRHTVANNDDCTICLEKVKSTEAKILPCEHVFHHDCIRHWLDTTSQMLHTACPNCREIFDGKLISQ